jgi:hypothetical protein
MHTMLSMSVRGSARGSRTRLHRIIFGAVCAAACGSAWGFTATLNPASPQTIYLQVGVGSATGDYINGGQMQRNTTINTVSVSVPAAALGNGTAQAMTTDSTAAVSYWDGYTYCSVPGQVYIGGFFRTTGATTSPAQVSATVPAALVDATGDALPFAKISWTSSGNGDSGTEIFPGGTFVNGGTQTVGTMSSNTWNESCWTFSLANNGMLAAGSYSGSVLYTMSAP